jgi:type II secretory pathway pseudopilin PulG
MIVLSIIAIVAAFAIPNLMKNRMSANETAALGAPRTMMSAQSTFFNRHGKYAANLAALKTEGLIESSLATVGFKSGYVFGEKNTSSNYSFVFFAAPDDDTRSGQKEYSVNQRGTVFESDFDSSGLTGIRNTNWDSPPVGFTVHANFVLDPESYTTIWTPISQ